MRILMSALAIASLAGALQAGDWTAAYGGVSPGRQLHEAGIDGGRVRVGLHGGYDADFGDLDLGGALQLVHMQLVSSSGAAGTAGRLKFRAGHDFGPVVRSAAPGAVPGDVPTGQEDGVVYGLGLMSAFGDRLTLGRAALRQVFGNIAGGGQNPKTNSFTVRVSFRF